MLQASNISFNESKALNPLVFDYLEQKKELQSFYNFFPDKNGFSEILKSNSYSDFNREELFWILNLQTQAVKNTSEETKSNIELLKNKTTFTVTTGHQLCLFTGPLYFIHKLFSVINLAEDLKKDFPEFDFVPVYWMAGEDHDFEEVNHFNVFGKKIKWDSEQKGVVGRFNTSELKGVFETFKQIAGNSENAKRLLELFEKSYLKHANLKDATRFLINELFGKYGLVIADGDDKAFKIQAVKLFEQDVFKNISFTQVNKSIEQLTKLKYKNQVNPREINCFYLSENDRIRIEKEGDNYRIGNNSFNAQQIKELIVNSPEKISPNVVLRPVFQQSILPNIAYVGGPGELAYWLQYKQMFSEYKIQFPILVPRAFVTVIDKNTATKIEKLGFSDSDFFKPEDELIKIFLQKSNQVFSLNQEKEKISEYYKLVSKRIHEVDASLLASVSAEEQKALNSLEQISQKANKSLKQKSEVQLNQIKQIKQKLFPENVPQERFDNFSGLYLNLGDDFLKYLKQELRPLRFNHSIISEK